ncbi:MAG: BatA domain-containing protein [Bacteroidota bacterium]
MWQFLNPYYLWAALGLSIPFLIHLWNRQRARVQKTGSIQWLIEAEITRVNRVQFHDLPRFILRASIILLMVFLLMDPAWLGEANSSNTSNKWLLIEPQLPAQDFVDSFADSLREKGWQLRSLRPHFPAYPPVDTMQANVELNYWDLLKDLEASPMSFDSIIILSQRRQTNFRGTLPRIQLPISWYSIPAKQSPAFIYSARDLGNDTLEVIVGQKVDPSFKLENQMLPKAANLNQGYQLSNHSLIPDNPELPPVILEKPDSLKCTIYYQKGFDKDRATLVSAWRALGEYLGLFVQIDSYPLRMDTEIVESDFVFLLGTDTLPRPAQTSRGQTFIYRDQAQRVLITKADSSKSFFNLNRRLDPKLNPEIIAGNQLPLALLQILPDYQAKTKGLDLLDPRAMHLASTGIDYGKKQSLPNMNKTSEYSLRFYLGTLLFLLILGERHWDYLLKIT